MDPVTLIVTALAAGAVLGLKDTASLAVSDAYTSLKALARRRLSRCPDGDLVLTRHAQAPTTWEGPLAAELAAAGAGSDTNLVAAAHALLVLADEAGFRTGKYAVDMRGSRGVQIGDHNTQHNKFEPPGRGLRRGQMARPVDLQELSGGEPALAGDVWRESGPPAPNGGGGSPLGARAPSC
jgi:hypothetical protein